MLLTAVARLLKRVIITDLKEILTIEIIKSLILIILTIGEIIST
jgi:hypothetical protein